MFAVAQRSAPTSHGERTRQTKLLLFKPVYSPGPDRIPGCVPRFCASRSSLIYGRCPLWFLFIKKVASWMHAILKESPNC